MFNLIVTAPESDHAISNEIWYYASLIQKIFFIEKLRELGSQCITKPAEWTAAWHKVTDTPPWWSTNITGKGGNWVTSLCVLTESLVKGKPLETWDQATEKTPVWENSKVKPIQCFGVPGLEIKVLEPLERPERDRSMLRKVQCEISGAMLLLVSLGFVYMLNVVDFS